MAVVTYSAAVVATKHAPHYLGYDVTLCGVANEAFEDGLSDEPIIYAATGEAVTCEDCRNCIQHCRAMFTSKFVVKEIRQ